MREIALVDMLDHAVRTLAWRLANEADAVAKQDFERGGVLWGAACAEGERMPNWEILSARLGDVLPDKREPRFVAAFERGRGLDLWDAAAIALGNTRRWTRSRTSSGAASRSLTDAPARSFCS